MSVKRSYGALYIISFAAEILMKHNSSIVFIVNKNQHIQIKAYAMSKP